MQLKVGKNTMFLIVFVMFEKLCLLVSSQRTNVTVDNVLYTFYKVKVNYKLAGYFCNSTGSNLVNIKTKRIQAIIIRELFNTYDAQPSQDQNIGYWVGGHKKNEDETWVWEDKTPISTNSSSTLNYSQYNAFRNRLGMEDPNCLAVDYVGRWKIQPCNLLNYFICQKDLKREEFRTNLTSQTPRKIEKSSSFENEKLFYVVIIVLSTLIVFLLIACSILGKKFSDSKKALKLSNAPRRQLSNTYTYQEFLRPSPEHRTVPPVIRNHQEIANSRSDLSYEVVSVINNSNGLVVPSVRRTERLRTESATYTEIQARPNSRMVIRSKSEERLFSDGGGYLYMRPAGDSFAKTNTLPLSQKRNTFTLG